eukprot:scaffold134138_cov30-Tisochrysis_lutea.AAC.1
MARTFLAVHRRRRGCGDGRKQFRESRAHALLELLDFGMQCWKKFPLCAVMLLLRTTFPKLWKIPSMLGTRSWSCAFQFWRGSESSDFF